MRFVMMGSGGMGAYFGGLLVRAGHDVTFIARGANLEALQTRGLTVRPGGEAFHVAVRATGDPAEAGPVDVVWLCVKTYDLDAAIHLIKPAVGPETMVLPVQNGVEAAERIGAVVGSEAVLGGVVDGGATLIEPGVVEQKMGRCALRFGELQGGPSARTERLLRVLQEADIEATLVPDVQVAIWDKFAFACMAVGLTALTRLPLGPMLAAPAMRELARGVLEEVEAVARAKGIRLPEGTSERLFQAGLSVATANPGSRGSMYFDLAAGRRLEVDAMNGAAVRIGRALGVPAPFNFAVYAALEPYADGAPALPD